MRSISAAQVGESVLGLRRRRSRWTLLAAAALVSALQLLPLRAADRVELRAYGSIEVDEVEEWIAAFERANPDIKLSLVRGSTGVLTARILAEGAAPHADVIWRLADSSLIKFEREGLLEPYTPKGWSEIAPAFRPRSVPPAWVAHMGYMGVICTNPAEMQRLGIGPVSSWRDLLDPRLRGRIVMPSPASSGTGLLHLTSWLAQLGEAAGWDYVAALNGNIAFYTSSGSKPCALAAAGEYPIGLSFSTRGAALKAQGAPIELIFPREGVGRDIEGSAILVGTRNLAAAQRFMDWVIGAQAMRLYGKRYPLLGAGDAPALPFHPNRPHTLVTPMDSYALAAKREQVIRKWEQAHSQKTEP